MTQTRKKRKKTRAGEGCELWIFIYIFWSIWWTWTCERAAGDIDKHLDKIKRKAKLQKKGGTCDPKRAERQFKRVQAAIPISGSKHDWYLIHAACLLARTVCIDLRSQWGIYRSILIRAEDGNGGLDEVDLDEKSEKSDSEEFGQLLSIVLLLYVWLSS